MKCIKLKSLLKRLREELVFDEEKEEVISKLSEAKINLNIYDYSLDEILAHIEEINVMEDYGEKLEDKIEMLIITKKNKNYIFKLSINTYL